MATAVSVDVHCPVYIGWRFPIKILSCGHSFCFPCLVRLRERQGKNCLLTCPACRSWTYVGPGIGLTKLPTNFALQRLLEQVGATIDGQPSSTDSLTCSSLINAPITHARPPTRLILSVRDILMPAEQGSSVFTSASSSHTLMEPSERFSGLNVVSEDVNSDYDGSMVSSTSCTAELFDDQANTDDYQSVDMINETSINCICSGSVSIWSEESSSDSE